MRIFFWNRDTEDWKTKNSSKILNYVVTSKSSGSIILLHESHEVVDTLPKIIEHLQAQELQIVNLK